MADARKRIVLGVEDNQPATGAVVGGEARLDPISMRYHLKAQLLQERDKSLMGFVLLVCELRIRVNLDTRGFWVRTFASPGGWLGLGWGLRND